VYVKKFWKRREYAAKAVGNWSLHFIDTVTLCNRGNPNGKKIVVFVRAISDIRLFKEAKALKNSGEYYTVFFTKVIDRNLMRPAFDEIHPLINIGSMVKIIKSLSVKSVILAIHVSSPPANICRRLIEMYLPWPVIFDQYDSWMVTMGPDYRVDSSNRMYDLEQQIKDEKLCYENADGVISKTTEIDYIKSILNVTCPTLIYPDYALEDWFVEPKELVRTADRKLHLVYAGSVHGNSVPDSLGYSKFFDFAYNMNKQKINFHIYLNPGQTVAANEYKELAKKLPFFHFHKPRKPWEIQKEIAKYDFALNIAWSEKSSSQQKEKSRTATGVKFGTYLEAALPVIVNKTLPYISEVVTKENIGFIIENDRAIVPEELLAKRNRFREKIIEFRQKFSCSRHVAELISLYIEAKRRKKT